MIVTVREWSTFHHTRQGVFGAGFNLHQQRVRRFGQVKALALVGLDARQQCQWFRSR
jgi:hypothetical protein